MNVLHRCGCYVRYCLGRIFTRLERFESASREFRAVLASAPEYLPARIYLADSLAQLGEFDLAILEYRELVARTPDYAHAHHGLGAALGQINRHEEAVEALQAAVERDPQSPDIYYNLGCSYVALGKLQDALVAYRRAVNLKPDNTDFLVNLGATLGELRHWEDAAAVHRRALSLKAEFNPAYNLGVALYELGRYSEAEDAFRAALRQKETPSSNPRPPETRVRLAFAIAEQGRHDEAIAMLQALRKAEPENGLILVALSVIYLAADQAEDALRTGRAAVEQFPVLADAHTALGWAHIKAGSAAAARESFERALQLGPDDVYSLAGLGVALSMLGDHITALGHFDEVIRRDPEYFTHRPEWAEYVTKSRLAARAI